MMTSCVAAVGSATSGGSPGVEASDSVAISLEEPASDAPARSVVGGAVVDGGALAIAACGGGFARSPPPLGRVRWGQQESPAKIATAWNRLTERFRGQ